MEQQTSEAMPVTTRSIGIRYGVIGGAIGIVYFVVLNLTGVNMSAGYWNWIGYGITAVLLFLAQKNFKEENAGFMNYGEGIGIAFWYGLIAATLSSIFTYIYIKFIDNAFIQSITDSQIEKLQEQGMSDEQIDQALKISAMFTNPEAILIMGLIFGVIGTIIIALILTIFTQKKAPDQVF